MKRKDDSFGMKHKLKWSLYELFRRGGAGTRKMLRVKEGGVQTAKNKRFKETGFIIVMLIIPVINFLIFWVGVNFNQILLAFKKIEGDKYVYTLENFKEIFLVIAGKSTKLEIWSSLKNTTIFWLFDNVLLFPLIIFCAYVMKKKVLGTRVFRVVFYLPAIVSHVALTAMFKYLITSDAPLAVYYKLFTHSVPSINFWDTEHAMGMLLVYGFMTGLGGNLVLISGAMSRVPDELVESAALDGATMFTEFFKIYLPLCWPTFSTLLIMGAAGFFNASGQVVLLTEGVGNTWTFSYFMFNFVEGGDYTIPAAMGLVLTCVALPIVLTVRYFINKVYADVEF